MTTQGKDAVGNAGRHRSWENGALAWARSPRVTDRIEVDGQVLFMTREPLATDDPIYERHASGTCFRIKGQARNGDEYELIDCIG